MASLKEILAKQAAEKAARELVAKASSDAPIAAAPNPSPPAPAPVKKSLAFLKKPAANVSPPPVSTVPEKVVSTSQPPLEQATVPALPVQLTEAPKDLTDAGVAELRRNLEYLAQNIDQREIVGQVVRTIAVQLAENPQFSTSMVNADFDLLVRGLRASHKVAAYKKTEKTTTRAKAKVDVDEFSNFMKDSGFSLDDLMK